MSNQHYGEGAGARRGTGAKVGAGKVFLVVWEGMIGCTLLLAAWAKPMPKGQKEAWGRKKHGAAAGLPDLLTRDEGSG